MKTKISTNFTFDIDYLIEIERLAISETERTGLKYGKSTIANILVGEALAARAKKRAKA